MKMLPLYSCIISEHPGVPGAEGLPRRVGGDTAICWFENPFALLLPSPLYCNSSVIRGTKFMLDTVPLGSVL